MLTVWDRMRAWFGHRTIALTPHFMLYEADCRNGVRYPSRWINSRAIPLAEDLEEIRRAVQGPVYINSWYRTPDYNRRVGGTTNSQHLEGRAVDIWTPEMTASTLYGIILGLINQRKIANGGVGRYNSFVHYDHGPAGRRWQTGV